MLQASPAQQAELQKIKALNDKLSLELSGLTQKMEGLQTQFQGIAGAKSQVVIPLQAAVVTCCFGIERSQLSITHNYHHCLQLRQV